MNKELTQSQLQRLNVVSLATELEFGSELTWTKDDKEYTGILTGIRMHKDNLVYSVSVQSGNTGKTKSLMVNPIDIIPELELLTDTTDIARATEVANKNATRLNDGLPLSVATSGAVPKAFGFSGSELKVMRQKVGLTQVAVALALGMSKGSAAAIGDWEADRISVPPKHQAALISMYKVVSEDDTDTDNVATDTDTDTDNQ